MTRGHVRVVADISAHGLGHLTQIAPVLLALHARLGNRLALTVRTAHPPRRVAAILGMPFETAPPPPDPGLAMTGPALVDVPATRRAYAALHQDFSASVRTEAKRLAALSPDLLVSDVGYVGLAAAGRLGLPAVALCSLHWAEMMEAYLLRPGDRTNMDDSMADIEVKRWIADVTAAYNGAAAFLLAAPRRQVPGLTNVRRIAPVARAAGRQKRAEILAAAGLSGNGSATTTRIGVITFGGIGGDLPTLSLPSRPGWLWIMPAALAEARLSRPGKDTPVILPRERLAGLDFRDIVASADLVVTKTGYGTFMDCARHGTPCLFLPRPDWPEAPDLEAWITQAGLGRSVSAEALAAGTWLDDEGFQRALPMADLNGAQEAADFLADLLPGD